MYIVKITFKMEFFESHFLSGKFFFVFRFELLKPKNNSHFQIWDLTGLKLVETTDS